MSKPLSQAVTPDILPRPDFHFTGEVGRTYLDSDPAQFPQPVQPPKGAPNVVLILLNDVGFGQFSTFGGGVPSPTMDRLAAEGIRYNYFHTTALAIGRVIDAVKELPDADNTVIIYIAGDNGSSAEGGLEGSTPPTVSVSPTCALNPSSSRRRPTLHKAVTGLCNFATYSPLSFANWVQPRPRPAASFCGSGRIGKTKSRMASSKSCAHPPTLRVSSDAPSSPMMQPLRHKAEPS